MNKRKLLLTLIIAACISAAPAWAGPGHDHGPPSSGDAGPLSEIVLTEMMIANLGIKTVKAKNEDIARTLDLVANIDYQPENQAIVSTRAEGAVSRILVKTGQMVQAGDPVIEVQPRLIGNPAITLTAPIDGFVTEQNIVIGQSIGPDQPLLRIADLGEILVRGQAYEDTAQSGIAVGQDVVVTTAGYPDEFFQGKVQRIDATLRPGTRVREILAIVENPDGKLLANMQATMSIKIGEKSRAILVPQRAILGEMGNFFVYVRKNDHFLRREISIGQKFGPLRQILSGIEAGEDVVTVGNYQLQFVTSSASDDHSHDDEDNHGDDHSHDGDDHDHGEDDHSHDDHSHDDHAHEDSTDNNHSHDDHASGFHDGHDGHDDHNDHDGHAH